MLNFRVETETRSDGTAFVSVAGELDMYTAPRLEQELASAIAGRQGVIVDLTECEFLDSSALGVLLAARESLENGPELVLVASDHNILKIFQITGLDRLFRIERTAPPPRLRALSG